MTCSGCATVTSPKFHAICDPTFQSVSKVMFQYRAREGGIGQGLPELLRRGVDVGRVDEGRLVHGGVLQCSLQIGQGVDAGAVVVLDPTLRDLVDGGGVQEVQLLPTTANRGQEVGRLQDGQVLAHRLAGHVLAFAELLQALAAGVVQAVEQAPAAGVGQSPEHVVELARVMTLRRVVAGMGPNGHGAINANR